MARANDNWERLMGAVMRRNRLWEMFHAKSRTPSMSSAASSTDDPFLDLSDDKFESRKYVEDRNIEALTHDEIYGAQGIRKTVIARIVEEMVKKEGRLFDEVTMSHGGGRSQYGKFSYGYASSTGSRPLMEDFYETRIDGVDGEIVGLFGVFDGHGGGARAAEYVKNNLFSNLIRHPRFISHTKSAIVDAYSHTDSELLKLEYIQNIDAGSTACTAIVVADRLFVANVGDSRAVICRAGKAFAVSVDHKPTRGDEFQRIKEAGGFVMWTGGTWKVSGMVAVSRAFGHRLLKQYVVADPEIKVERISETLELLILANNGLWDVVSNEEAVSMIKPIQDPEEAARKLMLEARRSRRATDNITIIIVRFRGSSALQDELRPP